MDDELILPGMSSREIAIRRRVHRLAEFYRHVFIYLIVNAALWIVNAWMLWGTPAASKWYAYWAIWPTFWWGVGVLAHGLSVLPKWGFLSQEWEDRKVRQLMDGRDQP
jgi:hypothetical protein